MIYNIDESKGVKFYGDENFIKQIFDNIEKTVKKTKINLSKKTYIKKTYDMFLINPTDWLNIVIIRYNVYYMDSNIRNTYSIYDYIVSNILNDKLSSFDYNNTNLYNNKLNNVVINLNVFYNINTNKFIFSKKYNSVASFIHELMHVYEFRMRLLTNKKGYSVNTTNINKIEKLQQNKNEMIINMGIILYNLLPHEQNAIVNEFFIEYIHNKNYNNYFDEYIEYINKLSKDDILFLKNTCFDEIKIICKKLTKNNFEHNFKYELKRKILNLKSKCLRTIEEYDKLNNEYLNTIEHGNIEYLTESECCEKIKLLPKHLLIGDIIC